MDLEVASLEDHRRYFIVLGQGGRLEKAKVVAEG